MVAGLPQTVGFQASLILTQPEVTEPAQTFCVVKIAPRGKAARIGASFGRGSGRCAASGALASGGAAGRLAATLGGSSRVALMMGPGFEKPLLQATRTALEGERLGVNTPTRVP